MQKFDFFFGVELGRKPYRQKEYLHIRVKGLINFTCAALQSIRSESCFDLFLQYLERRRSAVEVSPPMLPRCRKVPCQYEVGEAPPEYPASEKDQHIFKLLIS